MVLVHICGTKIPFHGPGKEAVADIPEIEGEIRLAIQDVARRLRRYISRKRKETEHVRKRIELLKYSNVIAEALSVAIGINKDEVIKSIEALVDKKLSGNTS